MQSSQNSLQKSTFLMFLWLILISVFLFSCETESEKKAKILQKQKADSLIKAQKAMADSLAPKWVEDQIGAGEGLFQVILRSKVKVDEALKLLNAFSYEVELRTLFAGQKIRIFKTHDGHPLEFQYKPNRIETHILKWDSTAQKWNYEFKELPTVVKYRLLKGVLEKGSNLHKTLGDGNLPNSVVQVATDALLSKISFNKDARAGDEFDVLLKEEYASDSIVHGRTKVLFASYNGVRTGHHEAFLYSDPDPKSTWNSHYTLSGEPLQSAGLRFPVDRIHIVSTFGYRTDPITGQSAMHAGIDYACPFGSPVYAVAQGKVIQVGYDPGSGNKIGVKHADGTQSYYFHLSRQLVHVGQSVSPRQLIGKVGSTGRSTGPHLHLGFKDNHGKWFNPLGKRMIVSQKLSGEKFNLFQKQVKQTQNLLDSLQKR